MNWWEKITGRRPPRLLLWKGGLGDREVYDFRSFKASRFQRKDMDIGEGIWVNMYIRSPVKEYECIEVQMHRKDIIWLSQQMQQAWEVTLLKHKEE